MWRWKESHGFWEFHCVHKHLLSTCSSADELLVQIIQMLWGTHQWVNLQRNASPCSLHLHWGKQTIKNEGNVRNYIVTYKVTDVMEKKKRNHWNRGRGWIAIGNRGARVDLRREMIFEQIFKASKRDSDLDTYEDVLRRWNGQNNVPLVEDAHMHWLVTKERMIWSQG